MVEALLDVKSVVVVPTFAIIIVQVALPCAPACAVTVAVTHLKLQCLRHPTSQRWHR